MGGKASAPPPPDFGPVAAASERAAELSYDMAVQQLDWAQEQYFLDRDVSDLVIESAMEQMDRMEADAARDRERYEQIYQPLEDQLVQEAIEYDSPWRREEQAGLAMADVSQQFDTARDEASARLESFGIDPGQTRAAALDVSTRTQEAAARAGAGNIARQQTENTGRALRAGAVDIGRGYPAQITGSTTLGMQAGNQAVNSGIATTATGAQSMGTPAQHMGNSVSAINGWWNGLNNMYGNQIRAFSAEQQADSGWGSALGLIGGIGGRMLTGGLEKGGAARDVAQAIKIEGDGMDVPEHASPSRGAIPDDIPARLDAGEFVLPEDVVSWYGEKHMHQQIIKAREERDKMKQQSGAIPEMTMLPPPENPHGRQAIPTR